MYKYLLSAIALVMVVTGCSRKEKELTPSAGGPNRAQLVKNIPFRTDLGLCAQLVVPTSGANANTRMIEISKGACPNTLVDDSKQRVFQFSYVAVGMSNQYELRDLEYNERAGSAEWSSFADKTNRNVTIMNSVCGTNDECTIDDRGGDLYIDMY